VERHPIFGYQEAFATSLEKTGGDSRYTRWIISSLVPVTLVRPRSLKLGRMPLGSLGNCYVNVHEVGKKKGSQIVQGYAWDKHFRYPRAHAWNCHEGQHFDITYKDLKNFDYFELMHWTFEEYDQIVQREDCYDWFVGEIYRQRFETNPSGDSAASCCG
jgi:hypothetical protein